MKYLNTTIINWIKINKNIFLFILFSVLFVFTYKQWLSISISTYGDWEYFFSETLSTLRLDYFSLWMSDYNFGRLLLDVGQAPTYALSGLIALISATDWQLIERIVYYWPAIFITPLSSFLFLRSNIKSSLAVFAGVLVYSFNTYFLNLQTGHLTLMCAYAFAPLVLLFYKKTLENKKVSYSVITALFLFICASFEPRAAFIIGWTMLVYFFSYLLFQKDGFKVKNIFNYSFFGILPILIFLLLSFYWIFGLSGVQSVVDEGVLARGLWGSQYYNILSSIALFHPWWTGSEMAIFELQSVPWFFYIIPIYAFLGLFVNKINRNIFFAVSISLLGIILAKQEGIPFVGLYSWLFDKLPGFNVFREASKFYFLIVFGYTILISYFLDWLFVKKKFKKYDSLVKFCIFMPIILVFVWNTKPFINGEIKSLFVSREMPSDYQIFKNNILSSVDYFRTYWIPKDSKWGIYTENNPKLNASSLTNSNWKLFTEKNQRTGGEIEIINNLNKIYSNELLDVSTVKYVIVPIQDVKNDDDFFIHYGGRENPNIRQWYIDQLDKLDYLEKIDIGTKELVVYENKDYKPYITASNKINGLVTYDDLEEKYTFLNDTLGNEFLFYDLNKKNIKSENTYIPFEKIDVSDTSQVGVSDYIVDENKKGEMYVNKNKQNIVVDYYHGDLSVKKVLVDNLNINDKKIESSAEPFEIDNLKTQKEDLFFGVGNRLIHIQNNNQLDLGIVTEPFDIYSIDDENAIQNASFEEGAWSENVGDCNAYDDQPILAMEVSDESAEGYRSIQLEATKHIACTGQDKILVTGGDDYIFGFDYQSPNSKHAGYYIRFNDKDETVVSERLPVGGSEWIHFQKKLTIPASSTKMNLVIYSYAKDNKTNVITRYDNFQLKKLEKIASVDPKYKAEYEMIKLATSSEYKIEYKEKEGKYNNLIQNFSLEDGLWSDRVGDCNNYDDNGKLSITNDKEEKSDGEYSLKLGATRHIACTGPGMLPVTEGRTYLFSFDYQSPNGKRAGYYLGFNDPDKTVVSEKIAIEGDGWQNYTKQIKVPDGASAVSLIVYSYAGDGRKEIITRYDNFHFVELPDLEDRYYLVTEPKEKFVKPKSVEFELINPTKKQVHIKGASTSFYLAMSESYHDQWQLQMNNDKINGFWDKWVPWVKPDRVADDQHFELNGFLNGWFVDLDKVCGEKTGSRVHSLAFAPQDDKKNACTLNDDGTYDIEMTIEFFPQRWFYLGLLISGSTFLGCIGYLGWEFARRRKTKKEEGLI